ncbi:MAG: carboxypeptidase M32 [Fimbriimonadaceae bacterium]
MSGVEQLKGRMYEINAVGSALAIMGWDQQTNMPAGGAEARAEQVGILSTMYHEMLVSDETKTALGKAEAEATGEDDKAMARVVRRELDLATKLPSELVGRKALLATQAHEIWMKARKANDYAMFRPHLGELVEICREEAQHLGYKDHPYDALTDQYEEGATAAGWQAMFDGVRQPLVNLISEIQEAGPIENGFLTGTWPDQAQAEFTWDVIRKLGFREENGRQDAAPHPFCTNFSVNDVRLTNRFNEVLTSSLYSGLHEAGHGLYEQNSPVEWDRTSLAGGVSLGVHESQSRTWENIIGRSRSFWEWCYGPIRSAFPALPDVGVDAMFKANCTVEPSLIRVEADEVTYNMHIMVRFELECDMVAGKLDVKDLPEAWNEKYRQYLGIVPDTDSMGCMQDVHWSGGSIGYFPTYSMGNVLSYQIWACLQRDLGDTDALIARGDFGPILDWFVEEVYRHGSKYKPTELIQQVTGKPLGPEDYLAGITSKYRGVYGLS